MPARKTAQVEVVERFEKDGRLYVEGEVVTFSERQAKALVSVGYVKPVSK